MNQFKFSNSDMNQIKETGQTLDNINEQLNFFHQGTPFIKLDRPCTAGDGIKRLSADMIRQCISLYDTRGRKSRLIKFVPASGAATRMFKKLIHAYQREQAGETKNDVKDSTVISALSKFMDNCRRFAFHSDLEASLAKEGMRLDELIAGRNAEPILRHLLTEPYMNYAALPKGLIKFHSYENQTRTAFEEHLAEAAGYARTDADECMLHFTVPPKFQERFSLSYEKVRTEFEKQRGIRYQVTFSTQKISTNTIAVDMENRPFRLSDGRLLFRPGGHGALIHNLNQVDGDIVFIKNIDNVAHERFTTEMIEWKKILCGNLIRLQQQIFIFLHRLNHLPLDEALAKEIGDFLYKDLSIRLPADFSSASDGKKQKMLIHLLDRPLRVCGMVPNTGEAGGGPFWVRSNDGELTLQIVESSQIDFSDATQKEIFAKATHFNPVDLVCYVRDFKGNSFDLREFVDPSTGFISSKSSA